MIITLKSISIIFSVFIVFAIALLGFCIVPNFFIDEENTALEGVTRFDSNNIGADSFPLSGEWEYYPDMYISHEDDFKLLNNPSFIQVPLNNIIQAQKSATYKISVENVAFATSNALYIQNLDYPIDVYLNGIKQEALGNPRQNNLQNVQAEVYSLTNYDASKDSQELVLSIAHMKNNAPLFKRVPIITNSMNAYNIIHWKTLVEAFLFGFLICILLNGFSFMILRPQHIAITSITLFDTLLILRLFFASEHLQGILESLFSFIHFSDAMVFSSQIFLLLTSGLVGMILAHSLLDEKKQIPKQFTMPIIIIYILLICILPYNFDIYYTFGRIVSLIAFVYTFALILWHVVVHWKNHKNGYSIFNISRTIYVTIIIIVDVLFLGEYIGFPIFYYPLLLFFYGQMVMKLIDNSRIYDEVSKLNENLEKTVEERTKELYEKNKKLSEISTHDPLTGAYNRLYFDEQFEIALTIFNENIHTLHLCMFDLDHFKSINDTYGHAAGDEQLVYVSKMVQEAVLKNSVFARVGGEEFMILYTEPNTDVILENIEKIRSTLDRKSKENKQFTTSSFGVTKFVKGYTKKDFLKLADKNLYEAKSTGRNKIVFH